MIDSVSKIAHEAVVTELLRLARINRDWVQIVPGEDDSYACKAMESSWMRRTWRAASDAIGMWSLSTWLLDGPKVFRPTREQCQALEQIEVRLQLSDYAQPYPAILIDLPEEMYKPFVAILCHFRPEIRLANHGSGFFAGCLHSKESLEDIVTTITIDSHPMEASLQRYDEECREHSQTANKVCRVGINACLALVNYGCHLNYLFPANIERDKRLGKEESERGQRARKRLETSLQVASFSQEVKLHRTEGGGEGESGMEVNPHWRRGHWAMQPYGPAQSLRKRILRPPVLVRADRFIGERSDTSTEYKV